MSITMEVIKRAYRRVEEQARIDSRKVTREEAMKNVLQVMRLTWNQRDYLRKNGVIL